MSQPKSNSESLDEISLKLPSLEIPISGLETTDTSRLKCQALETFIHACAQSSTFTEFITDLLLAVLNVVPSEAASVMEIDPDKKVLFFRSSVGRVSDMMQGVTVPVGVGIVGKVVETRMPLLVNDVKKNAIHLKALGEALGFEPSNIVAVPLVIRDRVYGVMELLNRTGAQEYSASDLEALIYLSELASKIIELRMMIAWGK